MKNLFKGLDTETQLLVALGSAVVSGCIPCLENIVGMARMEGIDEKKLRVAAIVGQFVKDQPSNNMKAMADQLIGTHLQSAPVQTGCPMDSKGVKTTTQTETLSGGSYECSL
jgi:hypothetical protein